MRNEPTIWWNGKTRWDTDSVDFAFGIEVDCILKRILNFDRMRNSLKFNSSANQWAQNIKYLANRCCQVD